MFRLISSNEAALCFFDSAVAGGAGTAVLTDIIPIDIVGAGAASAAVVVPVVASATVIIVASAAIVVTATAVIIAGIAAIASAAVASVAGVASAAVRVGTEEILQGS